MRRACVLAALPLLLGMQAADDRQRLADAKRAAAAARARAAALDDAAAREVDAAMRARREERALAGRVEAAAATVRAAEARVALVGRMRDAQRAGLAAAEAPVARLLEALTGLARRPTIAAIAQPGSLDDLVHLRAVLGATLPAVRARTEGVRAELAATRRLAADARLAAAILDDGRAELDRQRRALAALEARHRDQAAALTRDAIGQYDRALAMGERARDLVDGMAERDEADATAAGLATLPGPVPRPVASAAAFRATGAGVYRLPVRGRLVTGLGEVSASGVRSRGLSFAVAPRAPVVAPAGGTVRYAAAFRGYRTIVLIDHGGGWTSLLTGLGRAAVRPGAAVAPGAVLGRAGDAEDQRVTVELRRRGRPIDIAALL